MDHKRFAEDLRAALLELKGKGRKTVPIDHLVNYVDSVTETPDAVPEAIAVERHKAELQRWNEDEQRNHDVEMENFRTVIAAGQSAIKSILLVNGGAAVAMLAYIGSLVEKTSADVDRFALCLLLFTSGVLAAGLMAGGVYLTQALYAGAKAWQKTAGDILNIAIITLGAAAYGVFGWGMWEAYKAFVA